MRAVLTLALALPLAHSSVASAETPVTAGVSVGVSHSLADDEAGLDGSRTLGLFGRLGLTPRLAGQLEVARFDTDDGSGTNIRTGTAALVVDLTTGGKRWVPTLLGGVGIARESHDFGGTTARHGEVGLGLEYRGSGGLVIGVDARVGGRILEEQVVAQDDVLFFAPSRLQGGEYRSARLWAGVRF